MTDIDTLIECPGCRARIDNKWRDIGTAYLCGAVIFFSFETMNNEWLYDCGSKEQKKGADR